MSLRIGTRGSKLALVQTERACKALTDLGIEVETAVIRTKGDAETGVPLHEVGGQGIFVRALDEAIIDGTIDAAVHSMKDIPAQRPRGVVTGAVLTRDAPGDFLAHEMRINEVRVVGTASTRRQAQFLRHDPEIEVKQLRGNVDTRLRKLREGEYDAIVLAEAGLDRLGYKVKGERLPLSQFVPSPNQGAIAVVCRNDPEIIDQISALNDPRTRKDVGIERIVMQEVGGGCFTPQGIYCRDGHLTAEVLSLDGQRQVRIEEDISTPEEAEQCGRHLKREASDLIKEAYKQLGLIL
ncbi:hydroxymethylbilane synthase [Methanofollis aquaemaris]|uniref:Hydroxymethylbilane synthase n=1 Tax=Methanofollis aquaemaris TaxID=126734 RepID=A0A8A3S2Y6_9EURY|nr:hydroxymethylbilane synthase [Methanofollis aquaemaris]QSZ66010.1 hydroxymethylbilane synthase [Methanofollis aquaemaris]